MKNLLPGLMLTTAITAAIFLAVPSPVFAASNLYLSPNTLTVNQNANFTIEIRENSGSTPINAVQANLTYDPAKLQFISYDNAGSAFSIDAKSIINSGDLRFSRGVTGGQPPVTGDRLVVKVTFKALLSAGSTTVSFASGCAVVKSSGNTNDLPSGFSGSGTYTVSAPACKTADLNCDGVVNIRDFGIFLGKWNTSDAAADFNHDGTVNIRDFGIFLGKWGT